MPKTELEKLKEARIEMVENLVDMATTSKSYEKNIKNVADEFSKMGLDGDDYLNMMRKDLKYPVPFGVTDKDILQGELILKNLKTKGNRQLNAQGGRIGYEEAGVGDSINLSVPTSKTRRGRVGKGVAQTLDTHCNQAVVGDFRNDEGYRPRYDGNTPCLSTRCGDVTAQGVIVNKIRRLTPIECERLQGFPDNWTKYGMYPNSGVKKISDSQRYKMIGNAVSVPVVQAIGTLIKEWVRDKI